MGIVALTTIPHFEHSSAIPSFPIFKSSFLHLWEDEFTSQLQDVSIMLGIAQGPRHPDGCLCLYINQVLLEHSHDQSFYASLWQLFVLEWQSCFWSFTETACWPRSCLLWPTFWAWDPEVWTWLHSLSTENNSMPVAGSYLEPAFLSPPPPRGVSEHFESTSDRVSSVLGNYCSYNWQYS